MFTSRSSHYTTLRMLRTMFLLQVKQLKLLHGYFFTSYFALLDLIKSLFYITAELWTHRISLYYVEQKEGAWLHPENIGHTVIETVGGLPCEVNFQDLNVDGM